MKSPISCSLIFSILFFLTLNSFAKEILVMGDSHSCGAFGRTLVEELSKKNNVTLYCAVSSAPNNWILGKNPAGQVCQTMSTGHLTPEDCDSKMPTLSSLLAEHKESLVVVALGTNSLLSPSADKYYKQFADAIEENGQTCIWIGPPDLNPAESKGFPAGRIASMEENQEAFYSSLDSAVSGACKAINSRKYTDTSKEGQEGHHTVDGVHRTPASGKYWGSKVAQEILN
ncbi:MAG: hypothetical protein ACXWQQ_10245 [Pseudobdellovibrio sp.]